VSLGVEQVLSNLRVITQVELVVELAGCRHELWTSGNHSKYFRGSINYSLIIAFECAIKGFKVV